MHLCRCGSKNLQRWAWIFAKKAKFVKLYILKGMTKFLEGQGVKFLEIQGFKFLESQGFKFLEGQGFKFLEGQGVSKLSGDFENLFAKPGFANYGFKKEKCYHYTKTI